MAEPMDTETVVAKRIMLRGIDLFDREMSHQVSTSQRFTEGCSIAHLEHMKSFVQYSPAEAKADQEVMSGFPQGSQMHDITRYKAAMDNLFASSGMQLRYANQNPVYEPSNVK